MKVLVDVTRRIGPQGARHTAADGDFVLPSGLAVSGLYDRLPK